MATYAAVNASCFELPGQEMGGTATDEELVRDSLSGDENAFRLLYERHRQRVFATVYRIVRNREDARDVMQEVFAKVHRVLSYWDPGRSKFSTWLYRLASNHAIDNWRARHRYLESVLSGIETSGQYEPRSRSAAEKATFYPERTMERTERITEIRRCVEALPPLQKKVFVLRHFQGFKLREIAESEGHKLATVKTSLYRATRMLRRRLRGLNGTGRRGLQLPAAAPAGCR